MEGREREGRGTWDCDHPPGTGREEKGMDGRMGCESMDGGGRGGEGDEISIHGLKLVAPPMYCGSIG